MISKASDSEDKDIEITSDEEENINVETVDSVRALAARVFLLTNASFCRRTSNQS